MKRLLFKAIEQKGSEKNPHTSGTLLETICVLFVPVPAQCFTNHLEKASAY